MDTQLGIKPMILAPLLVQEEFVMDWKNRARETFEDVDGNRCALGQYVALKGITGCNNIAMYCFNNFTADELNDIGWANDLGKQQELVSLFAKHGIAVRFK